MVSGDTELFGESKRIDPVSVNEAQVIALELAALTCRENGLYFNPFNLTLVLIGLSTK